MLKGLETLDQWPDTVKSMQRGWIGKSNGASVNFKILGSEKSIEVFTT